MRRERRLPEHLRPLDLLVKLANLLTHDEIQAFRAADRRLLEIQTEIFRNASLRTGRPFARLGELRKNGRKPAAEAKLVLRNFSSRAREPGHAKAFALLRNNMRWPERFLRLENSDAFTVFEVVATIREALVEVVLGLAPDGGNVRLPEECYSPPAMLYKADGLIKIGVTPVSHWLLPMLDGLEAARLRVCQVCGRLFVGRRRDQLGCSKKCAGVEYMRRYRRSTYRNRNGRSPGTRKSAERRLSMLKGKRPV